MHISSTRRLLLALCLILLTSSCKDNKQLFSIAGHITGAEGKTLYLEQVGLSQSTVLDSVVLQSGEYRFQHTDAPYPEFYRLRLKNQLINFGIDSIKNIRIDSELNSFATAYQLDENDSDNQKIKKLSLLQMQAKKEYTALTLQFDSKELTPEAYREKAYRIINHYKNTAKEYIQSDFKALSAYFALFQQINSFLIFNPENKEDNKLYGALANTWNAYYPESPRARQLKNLYLRAKADLKEKEVEPLVLNEVDGKTFFDISLPDVNNKEIRMSEACAGKVTLIDFTAYSSEQSPGHNRLLAEIYQRYQPQGLEIYQVSLDADSHLWKNAAFNLPWICVLDPESINSKVALTYNITELPSTFIMNKEGQIVSRIINYSELEKELLEYLK